MNIKKCEKGHFYNADKYTSCPQCAELQQKKNNNVIATENKEYPAKNKYMPDTNGRETVAVFWDEQQENSGSQTNQSEVQQNINYNSQPPGTLPVGWLVAVSGLEYGRQYPIFSCDNFIGSGANNSIQISGDPYVLAEHHCALVFDSQQQKLILDMRNSTGRVCLNDTDITESRYLQHMDKIQIGGSVYIWVELCRDGFSWWKALTLPLKQKIEITNIDEAFAKDNTTGNPLNISVARAKLRSEHLVAFSMQRTPVMTESGGQNNGLNKERYQRLDVSDIQETNVLATATWRCKMCNGVNFEFANVCKICGAKRL